MLPFLRQRAVHPLDLAVLPGAEGIGVLAPYDASPPSTALRAPYR